MKEELTLFAAKSQRFRSLARQEFNSKGVNFRRAARLNRIALDYQDLDINNRVPTNLRIACGAKILKRMR